MAFGGSKYNAHEKCDAVSVRVECDASAKELGVKISAKTRGASRTYQAIQVFSIRGWAGVVWVGGGPGWAQRRASRGTAC